MAPHHTCLGTCAVSNYSIHPGLVKSHKRAAQYYTSLDAVTVLTSHTCWTACTSLDALIVLTSHTCWMACTGSTQRFRTPCFPYSRTASNLPLQIRCWLFIAVAVSTLQIRSLPEICISTEGQFFLRKKALRVCADPPRIAGKVPHALMTHQGARYRLGFIRIRSDPLGFIRTRECIRAQ